jgi:hypothetical protein
MRARSTLNLLPENPSFYHQSFCLPPPLTVIFARGRGEKEGHASPPPPGLLALCFPCTVLIRPTCLENLLQPSAHSAALPTTPHSDFPVAAGDGGQQEGRKGLVQQSEK